MLQSMIFYSNNVAFKCSSVKHRSALSMSVFQYIPELLFVSSYIDDLSKSALKFW